MKGFDLLGCHAPPDLAYISCRGFVERKVNMHQPETLKQKIKIRVARTKKTDVFLPRDFADLGGKDQVLRALRSLVHDGSFLRLGYGVYARAMRSPYNRPAHGFKFEWLPQASGHGLR
jgi:hypothetical protein